MKFVPPASAWWFIFAAGVLVGIAIDRAVS